MRRKDVGDELYYKMMYEWNVICVRLKNSRCDLSKIKLVPVVNQRV